MPRLAVGVLLAGLLGTASAGAAPVDVRVPAIQSAVDTGIFVRAGDTITISARGQWTMWKGIYGVVGPEGHTIQGSPVKGWGRLCARVGSGPAIEIPLATAWRADRSGPLLLFANAGNYSRSNAAGEMLVRIDGGTPMAAYLSGARAHGMTVMVPADADCVDTGVYLNAGETFTVDAVGSWTMGTDRESVTTDAEGYQYIQFLGKPLGQLVGRISGIVGAAGFPLGSHVEMRAQRSGILYLMPNTLWWMKERQRGQLAVIIQGGTRATPELRRQLKDAELSALRATLLQRLNALRATMGLPPARALAALDEAAQGHAEYQHYNAARGHTQSKDLPRFTGKNPSDRIRAAGHRGPGGEVIAYEDSIESALDAWMASVYHRQFVTDPALDAIGLGVCGRVQVVNYTFSRQPSRRVVACYPTDQQREVPALWNGLETPSPIPDTAPRPVGYTVSAHFPARLKRVQEATLLGPTGAVPCYTLHQGNDRFLKGSASVFLLPRAPLTPGTAYRAKVVVETEDGTQTATWSFTTGARPSPGPTKPI